MLYREIIAVCSQIHTKHINTLCGQNVDLLNVKLAVYKATTWLQTVNAVSLLALRMVITLCYDAISRNVSNTSYSPFVLFTVTSSTILPSCCVILLLMDRVGRKVMASVSLLFTGLFIGAAGVILATQGDNTSK